MSNMVNDIIDADRKFYTMVVEAINKGIEGHKVVEIKYVDSKGKESVRTVEPYEIKASKDGGKDPSLFAWCLTKDNIRQFKISQMRAARVTEASFSPRDLKPKGSRSKDEVDIVDDNGNVLA